MSTSNSSLIEDDAVSKEDIDLLIRAGAAALAGPKPKAQPCSGNTEPCLGVGVRVFWGIKGDNAPVSLDDPGAADIARFYQNVGIPSCSPSNQVDACTVYP